MTVAVECRCGPLQWLPICRAPPFTIRLPCLVFPHQLTSLSLLPLLPPVLALSCHRRARRRLQSRRPPLHLILIHTLIRQPHPSPLFRCSSFPFLRPLCAPSNCIPDLDARFRYAQLSTPLLILASPFTAPRHKDSTPPPLHHNLALSPFHRYQHRLYLHLPPPRRLPVLDDALRPSYPGRVHPVLPRVLAGRLASRLALQVFLLRLPCQTTRTHAVQSLSLSLVRPRPRPLRPRFLGIPRQSLLRPSRPCLSSHLFYRLSCHTL